MLALLVFLIVVAAVHTWEYQTDVQEYTFAQPAADGVRGVLGEKTPVAVEIGPLPWRPEVASAAAWVVSVEAGDSGEVDMPVSAWMAEKPRPLIADPGALADQMELTTGLAELDEARRWWWIPGFRDVATDVLDAGAVVPLTWTTAERRWIGCSHGGPLTLWLVHSRYRRFLPADVADPWNLTVAEAPWIGRVQFVEVRVKPGWCIGLPAHWGAAVRAESESWWWSASQHSVASLAFAAAAVPGSV